MKYEKSRREFLTETNPDIEKELSCYGYKIRTLRHEGITFIAQKDMQEAAGYSSTINTSEIPKTEMGLYIFSDNITRSPCVVTSLLYALKWLKKRFKVKNRRAQIVHTFLRNEVLKTPDMIREGISKEQQFKLNASVETELQEKLQELDSKMEVLNTKVERNRKDINAMFFKFEQLEKDLIKLKKTSKGSSFRLGKLFQR